MPDLTKMERCAMILFTAAFLILITIIIYQDANRSYEIRLGRFSSNMYPAGSDTYNMDHSNRIDVNTATAEEMAELDGLGKTIASRVVNYRNDNGPFLYIEEIKRVKGIGSVLFEKIRDEITI